MPTPRRSVRPDTAAPSVRSRRLRVSVAGAAMARGAATGLGPWLERAAPRAARGELTVAVVTNARMRALNRRFRGKDESTDVLSFPRDSSEIDANPSEDSELGDIAIAIGVARRQAAALAHPLRDELRVLALHGLLHLLGYDHDRDGGEMRRVEERLRRRAGLGAGLIARTSRTAPRS